MTKTLLKKNTYILVISFLSIALLVFYYNTSNNIDYMMLLFFALLAIISETFPIVGPAGTTMSVGLAIYSFLIIDSNPFTVGVVAAAGFLFSFPMINNKRTTFMNQNPWIVLFNTSNFIISFGTSSLLYHKLIWGSSILHMAIALFFALLLCEVINVILVSIMFKLEKPEYLSTFIHQISGTFISMLGIGSLGLVLYYINEYLGVEAIAIFFIPLLLARYSYKLYFDSQRMSMETIYALNDALHVKDEYTGGHTIRVEEYAVKLARECGFSKNEIEAIKTAAVLHDIGKIGIPDAILNKQGKLTSDEYEIIKNHSTMGGKILQNVDSMKKISQYIVHHHERYDGRGYPDGIKGDEISLEASILMIADSYDAMVSDRPYRKALSKEQAIDEFTKNKGTQFHPDLVDKFVHILQTESDDKENNE